MEDLPGFPLVPAIADDDDVDHSLAHITSNSLADRQSWKGKIQHIDWDDSLEEMQHDNNIARAQSGAYYLNCLSTNISEWLMNMFLSDLKDRLRASGTHQMGKTATREHVRRQGCIFD
jgi:hypothetical protein